MSIPGTLSVTFKICIQILAFTSGDLYFIGKHLLLFFNVLQLTNPCHRGIYSTNDGTE